jgi:hypothetical protein
LLLASRKALRMALETASSTIQRGIFDWVDLGIDKDSILALAKVPKMASKAVVALAILLRHLETQWARDSRAL